jgi:hypothetical protein
LPGITRDNVGTLTPTDLLHAIEVFDHKMEAGPLG